ncbi:MAG: pyridoxamine 5'-phosphate oxidase family protein [Pseudomonadota bacterium]
MTKDTKSVIRTTDEEARRLGRALISDARHAALAVVDPGSDHPMVSRVALGTAPDGTPLTLISDLSHHTKILTVNPNCSVLVGEPGPKGDPLTHPRITLMAQARFVRQNDNGFDRLRDHYLETHPKARLYINFTDFSFALFEVSEAHLNGGFGKAYHLKRSDLFGS